MTQLQHDEIALNRYPEPAFSAATNLRIVAFGGGTGLSILLHGLRQACYPPDTAWIEDRLTAIVSVSDDGGSSGKLRRAYNTLAPGDIRNCLLALSESGTTMQSLFNFRFNGEVGGHSLGNLILTALFELENDFSRAVERASEILHVCGKVLPATPDNVHICAEYVDGSYVHGESRIAWMRQPIHRVRLVPENIRALPQARNAIADADLIIIGPGSLYTSIIPTLLVKDISEAISRSNATVVLVMNLMTEPGETDGHAPVDFLRAVNYHAPEIPIHKVLMNNSPIRQELIDFYRADGSVPIIADRNKILEMGCQPVECDLLGEGPMVRHDPYKLAQALLKLGE